MSLVLIEKGRPLEIALRKAASAGYISSSRLEELKQELQGLVEEVTKKFIGFVAKKSVRKGLNLVIDILDFELQCLTKRAYQVDVWIHQIDAFGFKGLARSALKRFQILEKLPSQAEFNRDSLTMLNAKELIAACFLTNNEIRGYSWFASEYESRIENEQIVRLAYRLVRTASNRHAKSLAERLGIREDADPPSPSTVVNSVLLRASLGIGPGFELTYDEFATGISDMKKGKKPWIAKARSRLIAFTRKLPYEFREMRYVQTWFDVYFKGEFARGLAASQGIKFFYVVGVPSSIQRKMARAMDPYRSIPKETRHRVSP